MAKSRAAHGGKYTILLCFFPDRIFDKMLGYNFAWFARPFTRFTGRIPLASYSAESKSLARARSVSKLTPN